MKYVVENSAHRYYETVVLTYPVTQEMIDAGKTISFGVSYIPDPDFGLKMGSNLQLRNPQLRLIGVSQIESDYASEIAAIKTQQTELASRIATAQTKNSLTKADGFP